MHQNATVKQNKTKLRMYLLTIKNSLHLCDIINSIDIEVDVVVQ